MTNPDLTHLAFLLDSSGSMAHIRRDVEGGFDAFIADQRQHPGRCTVTLADFSGPDDYRLRHDAVDIADVPPLRLEPRGTTALLDAMGRLIVETGQRLAALPEHERPGLVIVGIMTDGMENASLEWDHAGIRALIEQQETTYGWSFQYLGANQDAIEQGARMGISADAALTYATRHAAGAMTSYSRSVGRLRHLAAQGVPLPTARQQAAFTDEERRAAGQ